MATLLSDTFTNPNGTNLSGKALDVGGTWTLAGGTCQVQTDRAQQTSANYTDVVCVADAGQADGSASLTANFVSDSFNSIGIIARYTDANNFWLVEGSPNRSFIRITEFVAGTGTQRASASWTGSNGVDYTLSATVSGTTISGTIGSSGTASYGTMATGAGKTVWGFDTNIFNSTVDNFLVTSGGGTFTESLAGSVTPAGSLTLRASKPLAGSLTASGALAKQDQKPLAGSTAPTGSLATLAVKTLALAGSVTPAGTVVKQAAKPLAGSVTPTGSLAKQAQKPLAGSTTPSGALSTVRAALVSVAGTITAAGSLVRSVLKALAGSITGTGTLTTSGGSVAAPTPTHPPLYWSADRPPLYWSADRPTLHWRNPEDA